MKRDNNGKHLEQCLAYYEDSVTIEYYCYEPLQEYANFELLPPERDYDLDGVFG